MRGEEIISPDGTILSIDEALSMGVLTETSEKETPEDVESKTLDKADDMIGSTVPSQQDETVKEGEKEKGDELKDSDVMPDDISEKVTDLEEVKDGGEVTKDVISTTDEITDPNYVEINPNEVMNLNTKEIIPKEEAKKKGIIRTVTTVKEEIETYYIIRPGYTMNGEDIISPDGTVLSIDEALSKGILTESYERESPDEKQKLVLPEQVEDTKDLGKAEYVEVAEAETAIPVGGDSKISRDELPEKARGSKDFRKAIEEGLIDLNEGSYNDPVTDTKIPIEEALKGGLLSSAASSEVSDSKKEG